MPNKIKTPKQFRFLEAAAHGSLRGAAGPSKETAKKMLEHEDESRKKKLARGKKP